MWWKSGKSRMSVTTSKLTAAEETYLEGEEVQSSRHARLHMVRRRGDRWRWCRLLHPSPQRLAWTAYRTIRRGEWDETGRLEVKERPMGSQLLVRANIWAVIGLQIHSRDLVG